MTLAIDLPTPAHDPTHHDTDPPTVGVSPTSTPRRWLHHRQHLARRNSTTDWINIHGTQETIRSIQIMDIPSVACHGRAQHTLHQLHNWLAIFSRSETLRCGRFYPTTHNCSPTSDSAYTSDIPIGNIPPWTRVFYIKTGRLNHTANYLASHFPSVWLGQSSLEWHIWIRLSSSCYTQEKSQLPFQENQDRQIGTRFVPTQTLHEDTQRTRPIRSCPPILELVFPSCCFRANPRHTVPNHATSDDQLAKHCVDDLSGSHTHHN